MSCAQLTDSIYCKTLGSEVPECLIFGKNHFNLSRSFIISDSVRVSIVGIPATWWQKLPRDTDVPDMTMRKRPLQLELAVPDCRWSKFPTGIRWRGPAAPCRAVSCRRGTGEGGAREMSTARMLRRSGGTGAASAQCGARSRARAVSRRCGTAHRRRCTCSAGLRARRGRDDGGGSWWWTPLRTVHTGERRNTDVAVIHTNAHRNLLTMA